MYTSLQKEFEKLLNEYTCKISSFHFNETRLLNQKLEKQSAEIKEFQLTCAEHMATIQQLNETISTLMNSNEELKAELLQKERLLEDFNSYSTTDSESEEEEVSLESYEQETAYNKRVSSQSFSYSSSPAPNIHVHQKRCHSELPIQVTVIVHKASGHFICNFCYVA